VDRHLEKAMTLKGARIALGAAESVPLDLGVRAGRITFTPRRGDATLDLRGYLILPGLINAHDHLEFNLFPRLGRGPYPNATAWAEDIYRPDRPPVSQHLLVPKPVRLFWGGVKNLLSGVTSVLHHNPYQPDVFGRGFPVRVIRRHGWAHSLRFSPGFATRYAATDAAVPFVIHAGEGSDAEATGEIDRIDKAGALGASTVIVHGAALDGGGIRLMKSRRAALVWCPTSNCFTLGRTVPQSVLRSGIPIALGTDSALTADGDLADELRAALRHIEPARLYDMVTGTAARILRLSSGEGTLREGGVADLVVVRDPGPRPADALAALDPELVIVGGRIKLSTPAMAERLGLRKLRLQPIEVEGRGLKLVECDAGLLARSAARALGGEFRLAGKRVTA
jgi:cytosine/adenosine deaminase-related metal-dependent hydrolase